MDWKTRIEQILEEEVQSQRLAGGSVLVFHKGREVLYHQAGAADREARIPLRRDTIFRIFSMTKPITAAAVMMLVDSGKLDLLEPVSQYLPEFAQMRVCVDGVLREARNTITIRDLLQMTSGLVYPTVPGPCGERVQAVYNAAEALRGTGGSLTTREMARRFAFTPLLFEPGTDWCYGVSADVLGAVIEAASGKRFGQFLKENIFDALGMTDTDFYVPEEKRRRLAQAYLVTPEQTLEAYETNYLGISMTMDAPPAFESGGAGLASTIDDYGRFAGMLLQDGEYAGKRLLSKQAVHMMRGASLAERAQRSFTGYPFNRGFTYGLLMRNMRDPENSYQYGSVGEYGWEGWLGSYFFVAPQEELTMIFMTQSYDAGYLPCVRRMRNVLLCAL